MGLILDSSVVITAERRGYTVEQLIEQVVAVAGDQDAALSSVGLTEHSRHLSRPDAGKTPASKVLHRGAAPRPDRLSIHQGDGDSGRQDRWRTAGSRCNHPIRGSAHRSDRALARLLRAHRRSAPLPTYPQPRCHPLLTLGNNWDSVPTDKSVDGFRERPV